MLPKTLTWCQVDEMTAGLITAALIYPRALHKKMCNSDFILPYFLFLFLPLHFRQATERHLSVEHGNYVHTQLYLTVGLASSHTTAEKL